MFPISAIYNHDDINNVVHKELTLRASKCVNQENKKIFFNNLVVEKKVDNVTSQHHRMWLNPNGGEAAYNFDQAGYSGSDGNFGYGIYQINVLAYRGYIHPLTIEYEGSIIFEIDATNCFDTGFIYNDNPESGGHIIYSVYNENVPIYPPQELVLINNHFKTWDPFSNLPDGITPYRVQKNLGLFHYGMGTPNINNTKDFFPLYCNIDSWFYDENNNKIEQNQDSTDVLISQEGRIPLNTIIEKNITTRIDYPVNDGLTSDNLELSAEPGVELTIDKGKNGLPVIFTLNTFPNVGYPLPAGNTLTINSPCNDPLNSNKTTLKLNDNSNRQENSQIILKTSCILTIKELAQLYCGNYSTITLTYNENFSTPEFPGGRMNWLLNSYVDMKDYSQIIIQKNGKLRNEGAIFSNSSNAEIIIGLGGRYEIKDNLPENLTQTISNGGKMTLNGGTLEIGANSKLIFDGSNTSLTLNTGSSIVLGENAKIIIKNGANFIGNGSTISSTSGLTPGIGISIEDGSAQTNISGCTFTNLKNSIYINNNNVSTANVFRNITNNSFNTNTACNYVIETRHVNNLTLSGNYFNLDANHGIGLLMRYPTNLVSNEDISLLNTINVLNNTFTNGLASTAILCLSSAVIPINFSNNTLYGNVSTFNFNGRQITGDIRNNVILSTSTNCINIDLTQSTPNIYGNELSTPKYNINYYQSYPIIAPVLEGAGTDMGWVWAGGKNHLTSSTSGNIYSYNGIALLDWGQNCFIKANGNDIHHLWGHVNEPSLLYLMRNNDFNGSNIPSRDLIDDASGLVVEPYTSGSDFGCINSTDAGTIWQIRDLGNGLTDTIYKTPNNSGTQPLPDQMLYSEAYQQKMADNFFEAISYLKTLINNYPSSSYLNNALEDLYTDYQMLDTSGNQGLRDILYNDLKNYLDNRILAGIYSEEFNFNAYNITVMCLANINELNEAKSGYEFTALYHPDAYIRLLASWDCAEINALLNGSGGISSKEENMSEVEYLDYLTNKVNASINEDPVKQKVRNSFVKVKKQNESKLEKEVRARVKDEKSARSELSKIKSEESTLDSKSLSNIRFANTLKKEERDKKQVEEILFSRMNDQSKICLKNPIVPMQYELQQNYPNPFNPSTTIKYSLPADGIVSIKIYDITGREVRTLVNEVKTAGNYLVEFNAGSFASGVYFYRIQAGKFVETKRMVFVK